MVPTRSWPVPVVSLIALALLGCAPAGRDAPLRSPTIDAQPPAPQTSDGRVVGVDNKSPDAHLGEGATTAHLSPGWERDERGLLRYNEQSKASGASGWQPDTRGRLRYNPQRRMDGALEGVGIVQPASASSR